MDRPGERVDRSGAHVERPGGSVDPPGGGADRPAAPETDLELLVHGVGGTTPERMLGDPRTVRITGDDTAAVFRRAEDTAAAPGGRDPRGGPVREAYVWCNLTSGDGSRALWLLLLPFMVVNLAHWMRPAAPARPRTVRLYGLLVRLAALTLTVLLVAAACEVALDLIAWQCAGARACVRRHSWLWFLEPAAPGAPAGSGGWWSAPGRRLALAAVLPVALTGLLWYLSHRTWRAYESHQPLSPEPDVHGVERDDDPDRDARGPEPDAQDPERDAHGSALVRPGFWYGRRLVARLRAAHTAAGLLTVAAAVTIPAARFDHRPGGPQALDLLGWLLPAALLGCGAAVVAVVCRRGRSENRLDQRLDRHLVRALPLAALALLLLGLLYAGWSRPGWRSAGRLPGDPAFGALMLAQGLIVVALAAVARDLYRRRPDPRAGMRGLGGPAVALLRRARGAGPG
ncbi:hypothetical protein ACWGKX_42865, partial [Streptomyces tricolor]